MLGYRVVREADWKALNARNAVLEAEVRSYFERLLEKSADARSKGTMADLVITRNNVLEHENGVYREKITGLPALVPRVGTGNPIMSQLNEGDSFEDVGDEKADELARGGLLHETGDMPAMPAAALMVP